MSVIPFTPPGGQILPPPNNLSIEQCLLGAILMNNASYARVSSFLQAKHFNEVLHQTIYEVCAMLIDNGKVASAITLRTFLGDSALTDSLTMPQYLARLSASACQLEFVVDYGWSLVDLYARRELMRIASDLSAYSLDIAPSVTPAALADDISEQLHALREETTRDAEVDTLSDTVGVLVQRALDVSAGVIEQGISTGLADLDRTLGGGLRPGRLVVLAGRPGSGKTVVELALAKNLAKSGAGVGVFSLEIDREECLARIIASHLAHKHNGPSYSDIVTGKLEPDQIEDLALAQRWIAQLPLEIDCTAGLSMAQIEQRTKRMKSKLAKEGVKLAVVCIDYLQLLSMGSRYKGNQVNELGEAVLAAKNMAKRLDVCVVLLSQLNRSVESREDKHPTMSDLRGSGNIEEHADVVGLLYRPNYYDANDPKMQIEPERSVMLQRQNDLEIIIDKNRLGPTRVVTVYVNVARSQIDNKARGY